MKSTKRILSAILTLCMIFGCLAAGFTAQASSADLQSAIDAAIKNGTDVNWKGGNVTVDKTIVINGDVNVNLNNATLTGAAGISVVDVKGGNVTLYNGTFIANQKEYSGETGFINSLMNYKPAVSINGGDVTLDCITAVGSLIRIPNSGTVEVTAGNGINANEGKVTVRDSIAVGMKALDNTKATVVIEDALFVGIYKAINDVKKVTYADGYEQYRTIEFLKDLLADGVTLTDGEEEYLDSLTNSQGQLSAASVIASVKAPEFADLESEYANGELTITAAADAENEKSDVPNRYSYKYTPISCTLDGVNAAFAEQADGTYTAKFDAKANETYTATAEYKLSVKLGKQQKEILAGALDTIAEYAEKAPALLYRFVKDFEKLYDQAMVYVTTFYNAKSDSITANFFKGEDMNRLYGLILALVGENFKGLEDGSMVSESRTDYWLRQGGFAGKYYAGNTVAAYEWAAMFDVPEFAPGGFFDGSLYYKRNADGSGVGIIEQFNKYYDDVMDLLYGGSTTEFADAGKAARYVGENWEGMLDLVEAAIVIVKEAETLLADESVAGNLEAILNSSAISTYIGMFNKASGYLDKVIGRLESVKDSDFITEYGPKAGFFCELYANKVLDIANNPAKYFDIEIDGDYVNLFNFEKTQEIVTPFDKPIHVTVNVGGSGSAILDDQQFAAFFDKYYYIGEEVTIKAVDSANTGFEYMVIESDGNKTVVTTGEYTFKAATNIDIDVVFGQRGNSAAGIAEVVFMTDKALGYKFLGNGEYTADDITADIFEDVNVPAFKDTTFTGWSMTADEIKTAVANGATSVIVYAEYTYEETVVRPSQNVAIKMTDSVVENGKAYFEVTINVPDGYKAIEAGVIATKKTEYASVDTMITDLSGTKGVVFGRVTALDADGNVMDKVVYTLGVNTTGTVYARGYIVLVDNAGNSEIVYTDIANLTV